MGLICGDENAYLRLVEGRERWNGKAPKPLTARQARRAAKRNGKATGKGKKR